MVKCDERNKAELMAVFSFNGRAEPAMTLKFLDSRFADPGTEIAERAEL